MFFLFKRLRFAKKIYFILSSVFSLILVVLLSVFPVENLFSFFKTPEDVFNYCQKGEIEEIVCAEESCLILYNTGKGKYSYMFVQKTNDGFSIMPSFSSKRISNIIDQRGHFSIYTTGKSKDYYIIGVVGGAEQISDSNNQVLNLLQIGDENMSVKSYMVFGTIENYNESYHIVVDGENLFFSI